MYLQHADCTMQQLYLLLTIGCTYFLLVIDFNTWTARCSSHTCLLTIVYIFYSSYTCNTRTARCSSYTCLLTSVCRYFPLITDFNTRMYIFYSSLTSTRGLHNAAVILVTYHWMCILSTHHILANVYLQHASYQYLGLSKSTKSKVDLSQILRKRFILSS